MTQQPNFQQTSYRQLRRSQVDRKIAGVCAGVAQYFSVDPTLVRLAFIVLSVLTGGVFLLAYLFAYLIMPEAPPTTPIWTAATHQPAE
jgi:phage shock protein C